jgi:hypothetical protein
MCFLLLEQHCMRGDYDMKYFVNERVDKKKISNMRCVKSILIMIALIITSLSRFTATGEAAETTGTTGTQVNIQIDYLNEIVLVTPGTGNSTKFYMSTDNKKTWEMIEPYGVDISTLLQAKETIVYFKGNKDTNPATATLLAEDKSLTVTYQITAGEGKIVFPTGLVVEYRKGVNGTWKTAANNMSTSIYEVKGATLYFRTPATTAKRSGKVVTLKISKRPSAPSVKLDGGKLAITGLKLNETQYRVNDNTAWKTFTSTDLKAKSKDLYTLFEITTPQNTPIPAGVVEFRTIGSDKKVHSAIKVVEVPLQQTVPDTIVVSGSSIKITDTDTKRAYEYTKVDNNSTLNMSTAKWTTVSSKNAVVVPKATVGDKLYIRLKSKTDSTSKQIIPASTYKEITITTLTK